jgi:hypothetical protein
MQNIFKGWDTFGYKQEHDRLRRYVNSEISTRNQGCQIFIDTIYQNGEVIPTYVALN